MSRAGQFVSRKRTAVIGAFLASLMLSACIQEQPTAPRSPLLPPEAPDNPQILSASWRMDVFRNQRRVIITPPKSGLRSKEDLQILADYFGVAPGSPDLSILAGDVVEMVTDAASFTSSAVGAFLPGLIRTTFGVAIRNRLSAVNITTPTFPAPPAGTTGVILFPFEIVVTETPGGTTVEGDGTTVLVELPNRGVVAPSVDWDVAPFNFFNDTGCGPTSNDCYRSETFLSTTGTPSILGGATSQSRVIGFDHEPTVSQFRVRMIVAGDLQDATPNALPIASHGGPYAGNVPNPVTLNGNATDSDGTIAAYAWDFNNDGIFGNDGAGSNSRTGPFTCTAAGTFPITLRATDNRGGTDTDGPTNVVCGGVVNNPPIAAFTGAPYSGTIGGPAVTISGAASTDLGGAIAFYAFDLNNDGTFEVPNQAGATTSFTCTAPAGLKTIVLRVTDNGTPGLTDTETTTVNCSAGVNPAIPTVRARWVNASGVPFTVNGAAGAETVSVPTGSSIFLEIDLATGTSSIDTWRATAQWTGTGLLTKVTQAPAALDLDCTAPLPCPSTVPAGNTDLMNSVVPGGIVVGSFGWINSSFFGDATGTQGLGRLGFTVGSTPGTSTVNLIIQEALNNGSTVDIRALLFGGVRGPGSQDPLPAPDGAGNRTMRIPSVVIS